MVAAVAYISPAAAQEGSDATTHMEVYGTLLPFFENVGTSGATAAGSVSPATPPEVHPVPNSFYTGLNHERRFRMTAGTSHLGFRGELPVSGELLKLIWQVESPTPIDGEGPNSWASRNSHVGLSGTWGTLVYGNWDTPMKWATATSVNPIKGGYVADMIPIIGSPGAMVPALNPDPTFQAVHQIDPNRGGFFRHEVNTVQYWSPTVAGFSLRVMYAANERRTAGTPGLERPVNPYLLSGSLGYDNSWLRLRYAAEYHNDLFGTSRVGGPAVSFANPTSGDTGHLALAAVTLNADTAYKTRLVVTGDLLKYHTDDETAQGGFMTDFSRTAVYALAQQTFGPHNVWGAFGQAAEGSCTATGNFPCVTRGMSAKYVTLGYLYSFGQASGVYAIGYGLFNDSSARYSPFPFMEARASTVPGLPNFAEVAPGSDTTGFGIGFVHSFNFKILGDEPAPKPNEKEAPTRAVEAVPAAEKEATEAPKKEAQEGPLKADEDAGQGEEEPEEEEAE
jgi:predicted porin